MMNVITLFGLLINQMQINLNGAIMKICTPILQGMEVIYLSSATSKRMTASPKLSNCLLSHFNCI